MNVNVLARFNSGELYGEWYRPFEIKYTCVQTYEYRLGTVVFKLRVLSTIGPTSCYRVIPGVAISN